MPIDNLLSEKERRQLEAVLLIALARDLLIEDRECLVKATLDDALEELGRLREGVTRQRPDKCSVDDR